MRSWLPAWWQSRRDLRLEQLDISTVGHTHQPRTCGGRICIQRLRVLTQEHRPANRAGPCRSDENVRTTRENRLSSTRLQTRPIKVRKQQPSMATRPHLGRDPMKLCGFCRRRWTPPLSCYVMDRIRSGRGMRHISDGHRSVYAFARYSRSAPSSLSISFVLL